MKMYIIQTVPVLVTSGNARLDLGALGEVIDFSILNPTASGINLTVTINGITIPTMAAGAPMLMLGGYSNAVRRDIIEFAFSDVNGYAYMFYNKRINIYEPEF